MRQNLTISLEKALIKKAKVLAAQHETSITGLVAQYLTGVVTYDETYRAAHQKAVARLAKGYAFGGKRMSRRDALHERP